MQFIEFLKNKYVEEEHPLDDDMPDGFPEWQSLKSIDEICDFAEEWREIEEKRFRRF